MTPASPSPHAAAPAHPRSRPTRSCGSRTTSQRERARDRPVPARLDALLDAPHERASRATRCRCCSRATSASGRSSRCGCFHGNVVFMLGPEANHYMTVSHAANFSWREGHLGDLIPLLGDGLLTIDGDFHRRSRRIMLPAFHRERIARRTATMDEEVDARARRLARRRRASTSTPGRASWRCGSRCARCSASTPTTAPRRRRRRTTSRRRSAFWSRDYLLQVLRGPGTPCAAAA